MIKFTDPDIEIDIQSIACIREQWILDRNDVEELIEISSDYGKERLNNKKTRRIAI
jgi:phosphomethylpyrimidine synthase